MKIALGFRPAAFRQTSGHVHGNTDRTYANKWPVYLVSIEEGDGEK